MASPLVWRVQFQQVEQLSMSGGFQGTRRTLQAWPAFTSGKTGRRDANIFTNKPDIPSEGC